MSNIKQILKILEKWFLIQKSKDFYSNKLFTLILLFLIFYNTKGGFNKFNKISLPTSFKIF